MFKTADSFRLDLILMSQSRLYYCHLLVHEGRWRLQTEKTVVHNHAQFRIAFCPGIAVSLISSGQSSWFKLQGNQVSLPTESEVVQLCLHVEDVKG